MGAVEQQGENVHIKHCQKASQSSFVMLQFEEDADMLSGVPIEIAPVIDLRDVTPDELVRLSQGLCLSLVLQR